MEATLIIVGLVVFAVVVAFCAGIMALVRKASHDVASGQALVVHRAAGERVTFSFTIVIPIIQRAELMDITAKTITIDRRSGEGLFCEDSIRVDVRARFVVRVNPTQEDVLKVARSIGCARASEPETLRQLFTAKFTEAMKSVLGELPFATVMAQRDQVRAEVIQAIGESLGGYVLDDLIIEELDHTPLDELDESNVLDAAGATKLRKLLAAAPDADLDRADAPSITAQARAIAAARAAAPAFDAASAYARFEPDAVLPAPAQTRRKNLGPCTLAKDSLRVDTGAGEVAFLLAEEFQAKLSRKDDALSLELRQRRPGVRLHVVLCAPLAEVVEPGADPEGIPTMAQDGLSLDGALLRELVAHLRWVMQRDGAERWV